MESFLKVNREELEGNENCDCVLGWTATTRRMLGKGRIGRRRA